MMATIHPTELSEASTTNLIDVRTPDEFALEHIPGSRNIPLDQLAQHLDELKDIPVILTCRSGRRAGEAQGLLTTGGCQNVSILSGGLQGWKAAKRPTIALKGGISIMRQVQIIAGSMILVGSFYPPLWFLAPFAGLGLLLAGLTNTCMMATLLSKMPWNRLPGEATGSCTMKSCS